MRRLRVHGPDTKLAKRCATRVLQNKPDAGLIWSLTAVISVHVYLQDKQAMSLSNALFWGFAGLFWQSPEKVPRAPSSRIPAILWYGAGVTLVASYTANLVTFLTSEFKQCNTINLTTSVVKKQTVPLDTFAHLRQAMYQSKFAYGWHAGSSAKTVRYLNSSGWTSEIDNLYRLLRDMLLRVNDCCFNLFVLIINSVQCPAIT